MGYFECPKKTPELADLNLALSKGRAGKVSIKSLTEVEIEKAAVVYEVSVAGLG